MIMRSSFSRYFFDRIGGNQTMAKAFEQTQQQMQRFTAPMQSTVTGTETGHQADGRCQQ